MLSTLMGGENIAVLCLLHKLLRSIEPEDAKRELTQKFGFKVYF